MTQDPPARGWSRRHRRSVRRWCRRGCPGPRALGGRGVIQRAVLLVHPGVVRATMTSCSARRRAVGCSSRSWRARWRCPAPARTAVALRGTDAAVRPKTVGSSVDWTEDGFAIQAQFRDAPLDEVVALVDGLQASGRRPLAGFEPPTEPAWRLDDEELYGGWMSQAPTAGWGTAQFSYFPASPAQNRAPAGLAATLEPAGAPAARLPSPQRPGRGRRRQRCSSSTVPLGPDGTPSTLTMVSFPDGRSGRTVAASVPLDEADAVRVAREVRRSPPRRGAPDQGRRQRSPGGGPGDGSR